MSIQRGYYGKKMQFSFGMPFLIGSLALLLLMLCLSMIYVFMLNTNAQTRNKLQQLSAQNEALREKLDIYTAALDSLARHLQIEPVIGSDSEAVYPYIDSDSKRKIGILSEDPRLEAKLNHFENLMQSILLYSKEKEHYPESDYDDQGIATAADIPSIYPTFGRISDGWGMRIHPIFRKLAFHFAVDISNDPGTPIYATAPGKVVYTDYDSEYGKMIRLQHAGGYETRYAHLYNYLVRPGDTVKRGQIIALMGSTGRSTGPHLHYEVIVKGRKVNPSGYLNRMDEQLLVRN